MCHASLWLPSWCCLNEKEEEQKQRFSLWRGYADRSSLYLQTPSRRRLPVPQEERAVAPPRRYELDTTIKSNSEREIEPRVAAYFWRDALSATICTDGWRAAALDETKRDGHRWRGAQQDTQLTLEMYCDTGCHQDTCTLLSQSASTSSTLSS